MGGGLRTGLVHTALTVPQCPPPSGQPAAAMRRPRAVGFSPQAPDAGRGSGGAVTATTAAGGEHLASAFCGVRGSASPPHGGTVGAGLTVRWFHIWRTERQTSELKMGLRQELRTAPGPTLRSSWEETLPPSVTGTSSQLVCGTGSWKPRTSRDMVFPRPILRSGRCSPLRLIVPVKWDLPDT